MPTGKTEGTKPGNREAREALGKGQRFLASVSTAGPGESLAYQVVSVTCGPPATLHLDACPGSRTGNRPETRGFLGTGLSDILACTKGSPKLRKRHSTSLKKAAFVELEAGRSFLAHEQARWPTTFSQPPLGRNICLCGLATQPHDTDSSIGPSRSEELHFVVGVCPQTDK
jgi:hypothetical protein